MGNGHIVLTTTSPLVRTIDMTRSDNTHMEKHQSIPYGLVVIEHDSPLGLSLALICHLSNNKRLKSVIGSSGLWKPLVHTLTFAKPLGYS